MMHNPLIKKAMIIDDTETDQFITTQIIKAASFAENIIVHSCPEMALSFLRENENRTDIFPDVIFLDVMMPVLTGFEFIEHYSKLNSVIIDKCKIIMLSSSSDPMDLKRAEENKLIKKMLAKPLTVEALRILKLDFATSYSTMNSPSLP